MTTSVTTHLKKLTTGNVLIVSVIVRSNCHTLQFLHQMFNVAALLLDVAFLKCRLVIPPIKMLLQKWSCFLLLLLRHLTFHKVVSQHN